MKALRWHFKEDVRVDEIPVPPVGDDEVLVEVMYSGICGSEVHEFFSGPIFVPLETHPLTGTSAPQTLGHEFGGRVVKKGKEVKGIDLNSKVTVNPILSCGECRFCRAGKPNLCSLLAYYGLIGDGGHAEYVVVKGKNCVPIPEESPDEIVAFGEPAAVAYHAVERADITQGSTVVVLGGGPIGQLAVQYARHKGAGKVFLTEIAPPRISLAREIGAVDGVFNPVEDDIENEILERTDGNGADSVIECCGGSKTGLLEDTAVQAVELSRPEGTSVIVGTFAEPSTFHFNNIVLMERKVVGSWVWQREEEYAKAINMIVSGKINVLPLVSSKVSLENAVSDGIRAIKASVDDHMKILIDLKKGK